MSHFRMMARALVLAPFILTVATRTVGAADAVLIYEAEPPKDAADKVNFDKLLKTIDRRISPAADRKAAAVRRLDGGRVEIRVTDDNPDAAKRIDRLLSARGVLEFRIVANDLDHKEIIATAKTSDDAIVYEDFNRAKPDAQKIELARWVPISGASNIVLTEHEVPRKTKLGGVEILVVKEAHDVSGELVEQATASTDAMGQPAIDVVFKKRGGEALWHLTTLYGPDPWFRHVNRIAIILDGAVILAPGIEARIGKEARFSGKLSKAEVEELAQIMNSGPLPTRLNRVDVPAAK